MKVNQINRKIKHLQIVLEQMKSAPCVVKMEVLSSNTKKQGEFWFNNFEIDKAIAIRAVEVQIKELQQIKSDVLKNVQIQSA